MYSTRPTLGHISNNNVAHSLAVQLDRKERSLLMEELQKCEEEFQASQNQGKTENITPSQLWDVFTFHCVPFIGFGFLDNFIMIVAGEYIDVTIGAVLGISTMAAAALGNLISDLAGVASQGYIESIFVRMGMRTVYLSPGQASLMRTRACIFWGHSVGIVIGCLLGMIPLLFFPSKEENACDKDAESSKASDEESGAH